MFAGLIGLLAPRVGATVAKLIAYVGIPLLILGIIWWRVDAWGDRRYDAGVEATDQKWVEAGKRLEAEARGSATRADDKAAQRLQDFETQVEDERKELDDAQRNGTSPLDVLFGA